MMESGSDPRPAWLPEPLQDVTGDLRQAIKELDVGEMVHAPQFSLFEAMSALELFDPKMDPRLGYEPVKIQDSYQFQWNNESDAIESMDRLLQCESLLYSGSTTLHSIFLCLWLHDPIQLLESSEYPATTAVKAYSLALLRCVTRILDALYMSDVMFEEDITLDRFGFSLGETVSSGHILALLDTALTLFPASSEIALRLQYRRSFLITLEYLVPRNPSGFRSALPFIESAISSGNALSLSSDRFDHSVAYFDLSVPCSRVASCPPRTITFLSPRDSLRQQLNMLCQLQSLSSFPANLTPSLLLEFSNAIATCLPTNIIPRAYAYLMTLSFGSIPPPYRLFLRCMSMNRSRSHRFTSKLLSSCASFPSKDFVILVLIHHVELMLELNLLSAIEYPSAFFMLDALYSSLSMDLEPFMRGCMNLAKGLFLSHSSLSVHSPPILNSNVNSLAIFTHRFALIYRFLPSTPSYDAFQLAQSSATDSDLSSADICFLEAQSWFSKGPFIMSKQEERAKNLLKIAIHNRINISPLAKKGDRLSFTFKDDHTFPIVAWSL